MIWVGGSQSQDAGIADRDHSRLYGCGIVATLDAKSGEWVTRFRWRSSRFPDLGHVFKGVSWDGDLLLLSAERELVWVDPETWEEVGTLSLPCFNDVHHAIRWRGDVWVASTGADCVVQVRDDRAIAAYDSSGPISVPAEDLRNRDLRPHREHPNHLFEYEGGLFCTSLQLRAVFSVCEDVRWSLGDVPVHDGVAVGASVWFTGVDGSLLRRGDDSLSRIKLEEAPGSEPLGWCRGLWLGDGVRAVGFTQIRATPWRKNLAWVRGALRGRQVAGRFPTRVLLYEADGLRPIASHPSADAGLDALFGVVSLRPCEG